MHGLHIGKELGNITNRIRRYIDGETTKYGVTHTQAMVIRFLRANKDRPIYQKDIEKEFDIRRSSVTSVLQLMEKNGFITRTSEESDARLKQIHLTENGYAAGEKTRGVLNSLEGKFSEIITDEEKKLLFDIIKRLENGISELETEERKTEQ